MAKRSINFVLILILGCFALFGSTALHAETTAVLNQQQKRNVIQQIEQKWKEFQSYYKDQYQPKVSEMRNFSYTYKLPESIAQSEYNQMFAGYSRGGGFTSMSYEEFKNKTYAATCATSMNEKKLEGWTRKEKNTIQNNGISIPTSKITAETLDEGRIRTQAARELNPEQGALRCLNMNADLETIKTNMRKQITAIKNLLGALNPNNSVSMTCVPPVEEGEECPPENIVYTVVNDDGEAVTGASKGCVPLPVKFAEIKTCFLCPLFNVILRTDQTVATKSFSALAAGFRNLIIIVMGLYVAWQTLITVGAFTKQDASKYLGGLMVQGFKVLVAVLLLSNSAWIYHYAINPLMSAGLDFGLALLFDNAVLTEFNALTQDEISGMPEGVISQTLLAQVMASIQLFNKAAAEMPAIGSTLMCISWHKAANILPDFSMLIEGFFIWCFGWAIVLAASFYLLDSTVRFGIFCTLLPFLIAAWPFKVTARYTKTGWDIFMNSFFNFVMMGLVIGINSELISEGMTGGKGGKDAIIAAINSDLVDELKELMDISGTDFLILIACCLFAFKLVGQINSLATEMAGGGGSQGIGNKLGSLAGQVSMKAVGVAVKGGKAVGGAGIEVLKEDRARRRSRNTNNNNNNNNNGNNNGNNNNNNGNP